MSGRQVQHQLLLLMAQMQHKLLLLMPQMQHKLLLLIWLLGAKHANADRLQPVLQTKN
jgi:hypothetical protein